MYLSDLVRIAVFSQEQIDPANAALKKVGISLSDMFGGAGCIAAAH